MTFGSKERAEVISLSDNPKHYHFIYFICAINSMNIYFAGSIRGGRDDVDSYPILIEHLKQYGTVLTEHVGDEQLLKKVENNKTDRHIHDRDMSWLLSSDVFIAEVTTPSLGVGYEIGRAIETNKRILCLFQNQDDKKLSAMINGCNEIIVKEYDTIDDAKAIIDEFLKVI